MSLSNIFLFYNKLFNYKYFKLILFFLLIFIISCDKNAGLGQSPAKEGGNDFTEKITLIQKQKKSNQEKLKKYDSLLSIIVKGEDDTLKRKSLLTLARAYDRIGKAKMYFDLSKKMRDLSLKIDDSIGLGQAYLNFGYYYSRLDKIDSAYNYYYQASRVYDVIGDNQKSGEAFLSMSIMQKDVRDYVGGEANSIIAIEKFTPIKNWRYIASSYNNLGTISRGKGNYNDAIENYEKTREFRSKTKYKILNAGVFNNIGLVYVDKGEYKKAIDFYKIGLAFDSLFIKRPKTYTRLLDNLAYARFLSGEKADYTQLFQVPLKIRDSINDQSGLVTSNLHLATYYHKSDSLKKADYYASNALNIAKKIPYNEGVLQSLELLIEVNQPLQALEYGKERIRISDSLYKREKVFQDQFARIRFETDRLEIEKDKATETARRLIIIFSFVAILFLLGYIVLQRRNNRKELEYQEGQQRANEEIFNLMLSQQTKLEEGKHLAKQRISEELHDGVLSRLFGLRLSLDSLNTKHGKEVEKLRSSYIDQLKDLGKEIRRISHDINDEAFSPDTLYPDVLQKLLNEQLETQDVIYQFVYDQDINWDIISNPKKVHIYRIIQECVMNINKHAKAEHITVTFKKLESDIQLMIEDDGVGMDTSKAKSGIGMKNIKSRVAQIAGTYKVVSKINLGTQIQILFN